MAHSGDDEPARDYPVLEPDVPMYRSNWRFGQCFGEREADEEFSDADLLSAVEFDTSGEFLATGDKGGRVVIFQRMRPSKVRPPRRPGPTTRVALVASPALRGPPLPKRLSADPAAPETRPDRARAWSPRRSDANPDAPGARPAATNARTTRIWRRLA